MTSTADKSTIEPILVENPNRFVLFPIKYKKTWELYKKATHSTWFTEEIDFTDDKEDFKKLTPDEQHFIKHVLAFFAASDGIVNENVMTNLMKQVQIPEARAFYAHQMFIENVHSESYSLMIDTLVDGEEKEFLFKAIDNIPVIKKMSDWAVKWMESDNNFSRKMIAFACIEGIMFSGPFCAIFWIKKRGLMPGLCYSNELISRDEGQHTNFAAHIYNDLIVNKEHPDTVLEIVKEVVELEIEFINDSLPCRLIGMNQDMMAEYVKYVADRLLVQLGSQKYWKAKNPFPWMELISVDNKTNFFEKRVAEYNMAAASKGAKTATKYKNIDLSSDF